MSPQITSVNNAPLENPVILRAPVKSGHKHGLDGNLAANVATDFRPTDAVDTQGGVKEGLIYKSRSLRQRFANPARQQAQARTNTPTRKYRSKVDERNGEDDEESYLAPILDTLDMLRDDTSKDNQEEIEAMLAEFFEPLQRYNVIYEALDKVDEQPVSALKKLSMKNALKEMLSDLIENHPYEVRRALQESDAMVNSLEALTADENGQRTTSTRDLRFLIGAKSTGNFDGPLTALTMLKALIKNFGPDKCMDVLVSLRSRMMSGL